MRVTFQDKRLHDQGSPKVESGSINSDIHPKSSLLPSVTFNYKISQGKTKIHDQAYQYWTNQFMHYVYTFCIKLKVIQGNGITYLCLFVLQMTLTIVSYLLWFQTPQRNKIKCTKMNALGLVVFVLVFGPSIGKVFT